ncbi:GlsB/YeaQ/YmgE family stress response membrane protein [Haploplasma axanthum]|uniref:Transglycosylase associated protein n=1 Tax=Haploplasma axanthum TaxID=29552 RepID=A0A449BCH4_HAPAX|nr:GlsB/YeaQ/YmgE family stress response membrane protein [Haploplasma axanthum]VEU80136.1 Transglycosylase associated protein [Haploplasma axanthum]
MVILGIAEFFGNIWPLVVTIVIGALIGWIAGILMGSKGGLIRNVIIGILGAFVGGILGSLIPFTGNIPFGSFIMAVVGAVLVIWVVRFLSGKK